MHSDNLVPFLPNGLRYLVRYEKPQDTSTEISGITLTQIADRTDPPVSGQIVAVGDLGPQCKYSLGATVVFGKFSGVDFPFGGHDHKILHEDEILGQLFTEPEAMTTTDNLAADDIPY